MYFEIFSFIGNEKFNDEFEEFKNGVENFDDEDFDEVVVYDVSSCILIMLLIVGVYIEWDW